MHVLLFIYLFIYDCVESSFLCEGFLYLWQARATLHRGAQASHYCFLSLRSTGSRRAGSVIVVHRPSCSTECGIFPGQGSNPCPLHWQAASQPLRHQGSPFFYLKKFFLNNYFFILITLFYFILFYPLSFFLSIFSKFYSATCG